MSAQAVGGAVGKNEKRNKNSIFMPIRKYESSDSYFLKNTLTTIYVLLIMTHR